MEKRKPSYRTSGPCDKIEADFEAYRAAVKALVEKIKLFEDTAVGERSINFSYYKTKIQWLELQQAIAAVERLMPTEVDGDDTRR